MKVVLPKEYKRLFTVEEYEIGKDIIKYERENDINTEKDWAEYAVREALKDSKSWLEDILLAKAEVYNNRRIEWDRYFEGSHDLDVYISATARISDGYLEIGAYLSDIWKTGVEEYKDNMFIAKYVKEEK